MLAAYARISPELSRAIGRFVVAVARLLTRLGYGWGVLAVLGTLGAGWAAWTIPTWWPLFRDWLDE